MKQQTNLIILMTEYHSDERCREALERLRWPNGVQCPRCEHETVWETARGQFECARCSYRFSVTAGTIFHDTKLPLQKWFLAVYLMTESKKGMSANQIKRTLDISYKTAWFLCHRIRHAMSEVSAEQLDGTVEVDETYVGGKVRGKGRGYVGNKAIVVGVVQRKGEIRLQVVNANDRATLDAVIEKHASVADRVFTDEWAAYKGIADADTVHESVNHKAEEWVRGDVHTNTVEGVWSLLKRSIVGSFHRVSVKHLDAYLDELEWRFNNRDNRFLFRDTMRKLVTSPNLEYKNLIA